MLRRLYKVNERRDDTTKPETESPRARRRPGSYYYDDSTGYEIYKPAENEDQDEEGGNEDSEAGADDEGRARAR
jgi:hypothetical protein